MIDQEDTLNQDYKVDGEIDAAQAPAFRTGTRRWGEGENALHGPRDAELKKIIKDKAKV